jgi:hypothetical protein
MMLIAIIPFLVIGGCIIILRQVLKSDNDVDLKVNFKRGEMSVKKKSKRIGER